MEKKKTEQIIDTVFQPVETLAIIRLKKGSAQCGLLHCLECFPASYKQLGAATVNQPTLKAWQLRPECGPQSLGCPS